MASRVYANVPASEKLSGTWAHFVYELSAAACDFTGKSDLALSPSYAYDLRGAEKEVDRVMGDLRQKVPGKDVHHSFATVNGALIHELYYVA